MTMTGLSTYIFRKLRYSPLHFAAMKFYRRSYLNYLEQEKRLFRQVFASSITPKLVFDVGANRGDKTHVLASLGASVLAIDPDPFNVENLRARFSRTPQVKIAELAVSSQVGTALFHLHEPGSPYNTLSLKWTKEMATRTGVFVGFDKKHSVQTLTLDKLISIHGKPDFVKIDVEGHELEVLQGLSTSIKLISFEVNLPVFRSEAIATINHYASICPDVTINWSNNECLMWPEWRSPIEALSFIERTELRYMEIYLRSSK